MAHIRTPESSQVFSYQYDPVDGKLEVRYNCIKCRAGRTSKVEECARCRGRGHNETYTYHEVPVTTWDALQSAESKGKALSEHVRKPGFPFTMVKNDPDPEEAR